MSNDTPTTPRVKRCGNGDKCIHPKGPYLPFTDEYYYTKDSGWLCKECAKQYRRRNHELNRDRDNARSREYAKKHKDRYRHYTDKYHVRKLNNGGSYSHEELDTLYKQQKGCCWWCGVFVGLTFDIDHRVPVSKGGSTNISNIVISCRSCNDSKKDKMPHEFNGRLL